jgi:subtilase family serine protease
MERWCCAGTVRSLGAGLMMAAILTGPAPAAPLIEDAIDSAHLVALEGNTRPEVQTARDLGAVDPDLRLPDIKLQLKRTPAEQKALDVFVESLQQPSSPNYHHWLTPEEFGKRFGADPVDIIRIEDWLKAEGFAIEQIPPGHMQIDFSGTAGQVAKTFRTEIHNLDVGGERHIANMSDPMLPAALAPAVAGIVSLNDFRPRPKLRPAFTFSSQTECGGNCFAIVPGDLQTIYNITPVFQSGISGQGQTIALAEDSDLFSASDFTNFRATFGLSASFPSGNLVTTHPGGAAEFCSDPGVNTDGDDVEATLDAEYASAAAPNATIELAACGGAGGVFQSVINLVNEAAPPAIISVSFGSCEADNGAALNQVISEVFEQAVAEGISIFVATGDDGPSDCANKSTGTAFGIGINGMAATAFNVAVGGTDFSDTFNGVNAQFFGTTNSATFASAKSYVPDMAWNDSCASTLIAIFAGGNAQTFGSNGFCNSTIGQQFLATGGGEGGPSACFTGDSLVSNIVDGSCEGNPKPAFQQGLFGNPADGVRDIPDVSLFSGDGVWAHFYLICFSDTGNKAFPGVACNTSPANWPAAGGTSFATPIMAAVQALINQKMGGRQGNPDIPLYTLARREFGAAGNAGCNANLGASVGASCVFHDVTFNDSAQACVGGIDCFDPSGAFGVLSVSDHADAVAYAARPGWDFATGIGTVNVANLVADWASAAP